MSRANLGVFEANLLASLPNLQQILNFYLLRNLASNELFFVKIGGLYVCFICIATSSDCFNNCYNCSSYSYIFYFRKV
ncbi:Hypothetical Cytosolic Protein [Fusobacterium vincentii ATCC 49256]|uniref:Hypothetical Cytosolic Protein n=1 Tax=Fusobacterium vincentii ATCC 49256 TaxID=209882 RepID=Q7P334_FUSVC|nr:Hypothetical Cytosolic Protein [Fusobacterium vincentii ATCC 49256]